jgi:hypothetical protein
VKTLCPLYAVFEINSSDLATRGYTLFSLFMIDHVLFETRAFLFIRVSRKESEMYIFMSTFFLNSSEWL